MTPPLEIPPVPSVAAVDVFELPRLERGGPGAAAAVVQIADDWEVELEVAPLMPCTRLALASRCCSKNAYAGKHQNRNRIEQNTGDAHSMVLFFLCLVYLSPGQLRLLHGILSQSHVFSWDHVDQEVVHVRQSDRLADIGFLHTF
jgi:hypothetical protein